MFPTEESSTRKITITREIQRVSGVHLYEPGLSAGSIPANVGAFVSRVFVFRGVLKIRDQSPALVRRVLINTSACRAARIVSRLAREMDLDTTPEVRYRCEAPKLAQGHACLNRRPAVTSFALFSISNSFIPR